MNRPYLILFLIGTALFLTPCTAAEASAETSDFEPATDAIVVTLDTPEHHVKLPPPSEAPRGPDRSFPLNPKWFVDRITVSPDGQNAFLLVHEADEPIDDKPPRFSHASIKQLSLDTGQTVASYTIPEPFATIRGRGAWIDTGNSGLAVSTDGRSLVAVYSPTHLAIGNEQHQKYARSMTIFRWDVSTQKLTDEKLNEYYGFRWRMLPQGNQILVWKGDRTHRLLIEYWDADDLTTTPLAKFVISPTGDHRKDGTITAWRYCIEYDHANATLNAILHWRRRPSADRPHTWSFWLQQFDTKTGQPTGPGTKFKHKHDVMPISLRGEHLLLHEQDPSGLDHRQTAHIWNVRNRKHVAAIDITPSSKSYINDIDLVPDGSAVIYEKQLLDLDTFKWTETRSGVGRMARTVITPDGSRLIEVFPLHPSKLTASTALEVYDLK